MSEVDLPGEPTPASDTMLRLERAMEKYAPAGYDPASDDLTIPFAMELVEKDSKIEAAAKVIAALREAIRWALGEVADDKGQWFGDNRGADAEKARKAPYWWRTNLRRISGIDEQTAGK